MRKIAMNSVFILLLVCAITTKAASGPLPADESYDSEAEEDSDGETGFALSDDTDKESAPAAGRDSARVLDYSTNTHLQKVAASRAAADSVINNPGRAYESLEEQREDEDEADAESSKGGAMPSKRCINSNDNLSKDTRSNSRGPIHRSEHEGPFDSEFIKRTIQQDNPSKANENDPVLVDYQKQAYDISSKSSKGELNDESSLSDDSQESRQTDESVNSSDSGTMNVEMNYEKSDFAANRDRRETQETQTTNEVYSSSDNVNNDRNKADNEDEETAIKKHIKRLSDEEIKELLNSLSSDKREILKKIIGSDITRDNVNKREIIKKSGAVDSNANLQSELNNVQSASAESSVTLSDLNILWDANKVSSSDIKGSSSIPLSDVSSTPSSIESTPDLNQVEEQFKIEPKPIDMSSNTKLTNTDAPNTNKRENKREIDVVNADSANTYASFDDDSNAYKQNYFCVHEDNHMPLSADNEMDHESNLFKREIQGDPDISSFMKSLEESFPCVNSDISSFSESEVAPLMRVKRKELNSHVKKRAAAILDEPRLPYLPYRAENEDEDNDEGNEFDDDGFNDRTSNFAKSVSNNHVEEALIAKAIDPNTGISENNENNANLVQSDCHARSGANIGSLGSDTDNVLSSVDGVDENLSFSSDIRNRRSPENVANEASSAEDNEGADERVARSTPLLDATVQQASDNVLVPNYQENDAFGALPKNYEGDLSRYKRIRHVKQPAADEISN